jgi:hypothetical protein
LHEVFLRSTMICNFFRGLLLLVCDDRCTCTMVACRAECHICVGTMQPAMQEIVEPSAELDSQILGELRGRFFLLVLTIPIYMIT